jgi:hypothetical protein
MTILEIGISFPTLWKHGWLHGIKTNDFLCQQSAANKEKNLPSCLQLPPQAQNILKWSKYTLMMNLLLMLTYSHA